MVTTLGIAANLAFRSFITVKGMFMTILIDLSIVLRSLVEVAILFKLSTCGPWRLFLIADTMACLAKAESASFRAFMISVTDSSRIWKSILSFRIGKSFCLTLDMVFLLLIILFVAIFSPFMFQLVTFQFVLERHYYVMPLCTSVILKASQLAKFFSFRSHIFDHTIRSRDVTEILTVFCILKSSA